MAGENWTQKAVKRHLGCRPDFLLLRDKREWDEPDPVRLSQLNVAPAAARSGLGISLGLRSYCLKVANLLHMKAWTVETQNAVVDAELEALSAECERASSARRAN